MKLERLPEYLTIFVTIVLGMFLAFMLGISTANASTLPWKITAGITAVGVALIMRANIWVLIPFAWPLVGQTPLWAVPLRDIVILYAFVVFIALRALKVVRAKIQFNWLDYMLFLNLFYLLTVYIRNPVGTDSMDFFDRVGGKPYFEAVFLFLGYWTLGHFTISPKLGRWLAFIMIIPDVLVGSAALMLDKIPFLTPLADKLGQFYTGFFIPDTDAMDMPGDALTRQNYLCQPGIVTLRYLYSKKSFGTPISEIGLWRWYWRMSFACTSLVAILLSGFRGAFLNSWLFILAAAYLRDGMGRVMKIALILFLLLIALLPLQGRVFQLPSSAQRTLSFIPFVQWDSSATNDAADSSEWRVDLWKNVWESKDKYIQNWVWGDGFGMTRIQLMEMRRLQADRDSGAGTESLAIAGQFHSLPLSTIHVVGYVGFCLFAAFMFSIAWYAWKLIKRSRGTPYFALTLFIGIPPILTVVVPIFCTILYGVSALLGISAFKDSLLPLIMTGFFDSELLSSIFIVAMLRMISRSLEQYVLEQKAEATEPEPALPELAVKPFPQPALN